MKVDDAKLSSIIFLRISTLGRKSCPRTTGRVWDGKAPRLGPAEGGSSAEEPPRDPRGRSWVRNRDNGGDNGGVPGRRGAGGSVGGGMSEPPCAATAAHSAAQEMLNLTQHLRSDGDAGRSVGGTFPQPPTAASSPAFPGGNADNGAKIPSASSAPRPRGTPPVRLSKLLNPRCSSTQHPPPGPGFLGARCPGGGGCWRSGSPRHSSSGTRFLCKSRLPPRRAPGVAWLAVRRHGCRGTQLHTPACWE